MTVWRVGLAFALALSSFGSWAQEAGQRSAWARDTTRIAALLEQAEKRWALYQWDSTAHDANEALAMAEGLLADPVLINEDQSRKALIRFKAYALGLLGRITRNGEERSMLENALRLVRSINDRRGEAKVLMYFSEIEYDVGRYADAIRHGQEATTIYRGLGDGLAAAASLNMTGEYYRVMGDPSTALECHLTALPIVQSSGDPSALGWNCILIGAVHRATRDWIRALEYFYLARAHYERSTDSIGMAIAYNDLGTAYFGSGAMDSSLYWHSRSADLRERIGSFDGLGHSLRYMARIYQRNGELHLAVEYFRSAIVSYGRVPFLTAMAVAHGMIAEVLIELGDLDGALDELTMALDLLVDMRDRTEVPDLYYQLARVHGMKGGTSDAVRAYRDGIELATALNKHDAIAMGYHALFKLYRSRGDDRNALRSHQQYLRSRDSVQVRADRSRVVHLMMKHDLEQERIRLRAKDDAAHTIQQLELEDQRRQKYVYIAGGSLFGLLALGLFARLRYTSRMQLRMGKQRDRLRSAKERAQQSEKFKERFLANMSHEIRTPMNAIMGMTGIMLRNEHMPDQKPQLDVIAKSSEGLLRVLNDILDLSKLEANRIELELLPLEPIKLVDEVVDRSRSQAEEKNIVLRNTNSGNVPRLVLGDPLRFQQVVHDLLENAIKLTEIGEVEVRLDSTPMRKGMVELQLTVRDTGPGIPADRLDRIFEEFTKVYSRGHQKYGGTGLGLAISKRLVELQGGAIGVKSSLGVGSVFTVRIPYLLVGEGVQANDRRKADGDLRDLRVLLADDNAFNVIVAQDELRDAIPGVRVDVALNGKEAVALARVNDYDVVLMDVQMPELSGYEATRAIRAFDGKRARIPILAMTANVMKSEMDRCIEAGMDGFVPKPFERMDLLEKLATAIDRSRNR